MNIATALRRIKQVKGELSKWNSRLAASVLFKNGSEPAYSFEECEGALKEFRDELVSLKTKVALANADNTIVVDGNEVTLAEAIIRLSELKSIISQLSALRCKDSTEWTDKEVEWTEEGRRTVEALWTCSFTTRERDESVSKVESRFQALNAALEAANHTVKV